MTIAITYITLGVLYTIVCVMDGQDVKPLWKRWLGCTLESYADKLKPIDYCHHDYCKFVEQARLAQMRIARLAELRSPCPLAIENVVCITEGDLFDEYRRYGNKHKAKEVLVSRAKQSIARSIYKAIEENKLIQFRELRMEHLYETHIVGRLEVINRK